MKMRPFHLLLLLFFVPGTCYAYLDPNAGSMLTQLIVGGGLVVLFRVFWHDIKSFFRPKK